MKVSVEKKGPCRKIMTVELPMDQVNAEYDKVLQSAARVARVPGFRKGRAPLNLVESHYARAVCEDAQERLISGSLKQALEQAQIDPLRMMDLDAKLEKNRPLVYRLTMDVPPEFKLPRYKGIALKEQKVEVTDEMVQGSLDRLLENYATYAPVESQPVRAGDLAVIDFEANCEGRPLKEMGQAVSGIDAGSDVTVMASPEGVFLPGFDQHLIGMQPGDEKCFEIAMPASFAVAALAGKNISYRVKVKSVREKRAAVLDEQLLKSLQAENEEQLRGRIRESLLAEMRRREEARLKDEIVNHLLAKTDMELPQSLVDEETVHVAASMVRRGLSQGINREQISAERERIRSDAAQSAANRIKTAYILRRIAGEEQIKVEDEEVEREIAARARVYRMPEEQLRKQLEKDNGRAALAEDLVNNKVLDFILANARLNEEGFISRLMGAGRRSASASAAPAQGDA